MKKMKNTQNALIAPAGYRLIDARIAELEKERERLEKACADLFKKLGK